MKPAVVAAVLAAVLALMPPVLLGGQGVDEAKFKPNAKAFEGRFRIVKERFDSEKRQYVWTLEAKATSEDPCHYDVEFQDADDALVVSQKVEFKDGGRRTTKGEQYQAVVKYPTRKTMERVTRLVVKKSD
jgi:hypothetical protein